MSSTGMIVDRGDSMRTSMMPELLVKNSVTEEFQLLPPMMHPLSILSFRDGIYLPCLAAKHYCYITLLNCSIQQYNLIQVGAPKARVQVAYAAQCDSARTPHCMLACGWGFADNARASGVPVIMDLSKTTITDGSVIKVSMQHPGDHGL